MARERYLLHAGEDTIHDPDAEKKAEQSDKTPHGKWENFWFYHKWHVLIGAAVILVIVWSIVSSMQTVKPDYTVGLLTQTSYPDTVVDDLASGLEKYGKDVNGDGKVVVEIAQFNLPVGSSSAVTVNPASSDLTQQQQNLQLLQANQAKWITDISSGVSMIFICDDASFRQQEKNTQLFAYLDGSTPPKNVVDYDKTRVALEKCPKFAGMNVSFKSASGSVDVKLTSLMKNCSISLRAYKGTAIDGKEDNYYNASKALFQKLIS